LTPTVVCLSKELSTLVKEMGIESGTTW